MGEPIGYGFTHDFALCRSAGAVRQFHRLRHAFSVQIVWYLSLTYGQAHRLSSGTPSARFSLRKLACRTIRMIRTIRTRAERGQVLFTIFCKNISDFGKKIGIFLKNCKKIIKKLRFLPFGGLTLQKESHIILMELCVKMLILRTFLTVLQ